MPMSFDELSFSAAPRADNMLDSTEKAFSLAFSILYHALGELELTVIF